MVNNDSPFIGSIILSYCRAKKKSYTVSEWLKIVGRSRYTTARGLIEKRQEKFQEIKAKVYHVGFESLPV